MNNKYMNIIQEEASDILSNERVLSQKKFIQHGKTTTYEHTINVTITALKIANKLRIKYDRRSLIRGGLLHDYFLYDWHENDKSHRLHGFHHARRALINAREDFELNKIEENIIDTHMFPLNLRFPKYRESIIIGIADKVCTIKEFF